MSDLVEIDDLGLLDGHDLRAVFSQISEPQLVEALSGTDPALAHNCSESCRPPWPVGSRPEIDARGSVEPVAVRLAQDAVVEALCRLSRCGQVAFDIPGDMVA